MAAEPDLTARIPSWVADHVADDGLRALDLLEPGTLGPLLGRRWPAAAPSVAATLWWYSASSTLMLVPVAQMLTTGRAFDMRAAALTIRLDESGTPDAVRSSSSVDGPDELGAALTEVCDRFVGAVSTVASVHPPSLWAIASDSLANRALDIGTALGRIGEATNMARQLAAAMPTPRFVDVDASGAATVAGTDDPAPGRRRFLQRSSCCLVFEVGDHMCSSCPRQRPETRLARLAALVR
ncbi:(2Fe-2S)-binding protein [Actinomycetes bacterium M1A6_2h]